METFITVVLIAFVASLICMCGYEELHNEVEMITSNIYVRKAELTQEDKKQ